MTEDLSHFWYPRRALEATGRVLQLLDRAPRCLFIMQVEFNAHSPLHKHPGHPKWPEKDFFSAILGRF